MIMELTVLGCGSAKPIYPDRNMSAQILNHNQVLYLIDCGEGTQLQLQKFGIKTSKIERIFVSHLHGDHILGLPGLISTMAMNGRTEKLTLHAHRDLAPWLTEYFRISRFFPNFPIRFEPLQEQSHSIVFENEALEVWSIPLLHSLPTTGFLFKEKPKKRKVLANLLPKNLPFTSFEDLKDGKNVEFDSVVYANESVTADPLASRAFAYCGDTAFDPRIIEFVKGVDLLYHEATFLEQHAEKALEKQHATAKQAAAIAKEAKAKKLLIGHYSSRYRETESFLQEAKSVFCNSELAFEGMRIEL